MEWLILLLLVPAIIVPVVLLWGFAGCDQVIKLDPPPSAPLELEATPISVSEISLSWIGMGAGLQFEIHRAKDGGPFELLDVVLNPPFVDPPNAGNPPPLEKGVTYHYQVFATDGDHKSEGSNIVSARPLAFHFDLNTAAGTNQGSEGDCIVQRIGSALLKNWGTVTKIHVRGSTTGNLIINSMSISREAPAGAPENPNPDPYDSAADLVIVAGAMVMADSSVPLVLPSIYEIPDPPEDLLIAFDISSNQGKVRHATLNGAVVYTRSSTQQATVRDRFPNPDNTTLSYTTRVARIFLVEKIEVL